jgi:hypothetical protein
MYLKKTVMISLSRKEDHRNVNKQKQDKKSWQIYLPWKRGREKWQDTE